MTDDLTDEQLASCPECGSDDIAVCIEKRIDVQCYHCGNHEYAPTEAEAIEKWNFLAKLKSKMQSGEITVDEAEHEYHDRYLKD